MYIKDKLASMWLWYSIHKYNFLLDINFVDGINNTTNTNLHCLDEMNCYNYA